MTKTYRKLLALLLIITTLITSVGVVSFADTTDVTPTPTPTETPTEEGEDPEEVITTQQKAPDVTSVRVSLNETLMTAELVWTCVASVEGGTLNYAVRLWRGDTEYADWSTPNMATVTDAAANSIVVNGIQNHQQYSYQVGAYLVEDTTKTIVWSDRAMFYADDSVTAATVDTVSGGTSKDNLITITYTPGTGAGRFELVTGRKPSSLKPVQKKYITSNKDNTIKYHQQCKGVMYYAIRSYSVTNETVYVDSNAVQGGKVGDLVFGDIANLKWRGKMRRNATIYAASTGSKKIGTIKKSERADALAYYPNPVKNYDKPSRIKIETGDGTIGWVKFTDINLYALTSINKDYPTSVKLEFVNQYKSSTNYLIWVNQKTQRYTAFKKNSKGKFVIVSGRNGIRVSTGKYYQPLRNGTNYKITRHVSRVDRLHTDYIPPRPYYFLYATYFGGSGYFHTKSIWADTLTARNSVNGKLTTRGCCRMYDSDAKFIYGLPTGTRVIIR